MADNVHYLGRTDTVPGVCVGNGFGVQFDDGATDPPGYPIVVPFDDCIKWFWRIKIWKITTDATASSTTTMASITLPSDNLEDAFMRTEELELVQPDVYINQSEFFDQVPGSQTAFVEIALFAGNPVFSLLSPSLALASGDYKPALVIDGQMIVDDAVVNFSSRSDRFSPASGDFMATVDGQDVTIYYLLATATAAFVCTQMDFEAADDGTGYWPYEALGNPVYDTTTGAQLQDPRN